jgi:hypothetical protein
MDEDEAINKMFIASFTGDRALKNNKDVDDYVRDNLN